jgi:hypothetical protein
LWAAALWDTAVNSRRKRRSLDANSVVYCFSSNPSEYEGRQCDTVSDIDTELANIGKTDTEYRPLQKKNRIILVTELSSSSCLLSSRETGEMKISEAQRSNGGENTHS